MSARTKALHEDGERLVRVADLITLREQHAARMAQLHEQYSAALAQHRITARQDWEAALAALRVEHVKQMQAQQDVLAAVWAAHEVRWHPVRSAVRAAWRRLRTWAAMQGWGAGVWE